MYFYILEGVPTKIYRAHQQNLGRGVRNVIGERAMRARHCQGFTNSSWYSICVYIYIYITSLRHF